MKNIIVSDQDVELTCDKSFLKVTNIHADIYYFLEIDLLFGPTVTLVQGYSASSHSRHSRSRSRSSSRRSDSRKKKKKRKKEKDKEKEKEKEKETLLDMRVEDFIPKIFGIDPESPGFADYLKKSNTY